MKLTDYVAKALAREGIECMFIFTGGAISHLVDSVFRFNLKTGKLRPVCVLHEQAGSMAADSYTRTTGKIGAAAATSGPGGTNFLTGICCSYYDSIPGLYFTGQVRTWEWKAKSKQRQVGFQETDIVSVVKPITKYATMVTNPKNIRYQLEKALWIAQIGRPGPVLIDLPMDVQWSKIKVGELKSFKPDKRKKSDKKIKEKIKLVVHWLKKSKRPIIICGGGVRNAGAIAELKKLASLINIPVTVTFGGKDSFPHNNRLFSGLIGVAGNKAANTSINSSDLVLAIGTRLAWRQLKSKPKEFLPNSKLVHVEIDPYEINQRVKADLAIGYDAKKFIKNLTQELQKTKKLDFSYWASKTRDKLNKSPFCKKEYYLQKKGINPYVFFKTLSEQMGKNDIIVADTGNNVMWALQAVEIKNNQRIFTAHAHSPMGYALPAAMGAAVVYPKGSPRVICTIGDGGFQLNIQELQTIYYYKLPIKIFIIDNQSYAAIKDFQDGNLGSRYYASSLEHGYSWPDFLAVARSYKIKTAEIKSQDNLASKIRSVLNRKGAVVCNVSIMPKPFVTFDP